MKDFCKVFVMVLGSLFVILLLALVIMPHFSISNIFNTKKAYTLYIADANQSLSRDFNTVSISFVDKKNKEALIEILNNSNISLDTYLSSQLDYYDRLITFLVVIIGIYALCSYFYIKAVSEEKAKKMCAEYVTKEMDKQETKTMISNVVEEQMKGAFVLDRIDKILDALIEKKIEKTLEVQIKPKPKEEK
jgi:predicted PurR-regulated permease PerM